jgi:hypothetical protein
MVSTVQLPTLNSMRRQSFKTIAKNFDKIQAEEQLRIMIKQLKEKAVRIQLKK